MKREFNEEFEIGRRRGVRCTARRLDVCGRKVDGGLEARRAVLPKEKTASPKERGRNTCGGASQCSVSVQNSEISREPAPGAARFRGAALALAAGGAC